MHILIADDHKIYRRGLRNLIQENHPEARITEAGTGQDVLDLLTKRNNFSLPDMIIMDLEMPGIDGIQATTYLRDRLPDAKIIIMTMHEDEWFMDQMIGMGVQGYLLKGEDENQIEAAIQAVKKGKTYFCPQASDALQREIVRSKRFRHNFRRFRQLSDREIEVLKRICQENTNREIAEELALSVRTVDNHRNKLLEKCEVKNTAGLVMYAIRHGLIDTSEL